MSPRSPSSGEVFPARRLHMRQMTEYIAKVPPARVPGWIGDRRVRVAVLRRQHREAAFAEHDSIAKRLPSPLSSTDRTIRMYLHGKSNGHDHFVGYKGHLFRSGYANYSLQHRKDRQRPEHQRKGAVDIVCVRTGLGTQQLGQGFCTRFAGRGGASIPAGRR